MISLKTYFKLPSLRLIIGIVFLSVFFYSCEDDTITSGDLRDEYIGEWTCHESSDQFGPSDYFVIISKGLDEDHIQISNFYNLGETEYVSIFIEDNSLMISNQTVKGNEISGSGNSNISFTTIDFIYTVYDGAETDQVTAQYVR